MITGHGGCRSELHLLARLRADIAPGYGCRCVVCGDSPYDLAGSARRVLGDSFVDYDLLSPGDTICIGCAALLAGRPGDDPPPLRTVHVAVRAGVVSYPDRSGLHACIADPVGVEFASWATSRKKHHWLRAGMCRPDRLLIGADDGTIEYQPDRDWPLVEAVSALLLSPTGTSSLLSREAIRTGEYHPEAVRKFGLSRWRELEATVKRWRPSLLLDLLASVTPLSAPIADKEDDVMIDPIESKAATLLARLATASLVRRRDGKMFWGGFFKHRVERFRCLALNDMVSRLMDACAVSPMDPSAMLVLHDLAGWSAETTAEVGKCIETRAALIIALAFERCKDRTAIGIAPAASRKVAEEGGML